MLRMSAYGGNLKITQFQLLLLSDVFLVVILEISSYRFLFTTLRSYLIIAIREKLLQTVPEFSNKNELY